ncbi:hypothetical protein AUL38_10675 [Leucobacter sp. G161]|nr:hypothetical protein AUL38_10675 [Leucobacter sp. G161]
MDRDIIGPVTCEPVDCVHDAIVDLMLGDVLDHSHQFRPVRLACRFASIDELLDDRRANLLGLATVRFALRGDRIPLVRAALLCLFLRGHTQVRDGDCTAGRH